MYKYGGQERISPRFFFLGEIYIYPSPPYEIMLLSIAGKVCPNLDVLPDLFGGPVEL